MHFYLYLASLLAVGCFETGQGRIVRLDVILPSTPRGKYFDNNFYSRENIEKI